MAAVALLHCHLCGLECGAQPYHQRIGDLPRDFCCLGCMNVYSILFESGVLENGRDPRESDLFQQSLKLGLVSNARPRSAPALDLATAEERLFQLKGLWCNACAWLIEHTLLQQPGIVSADVHFVSDLLKVRYLPQQCNIHSVPAVLDKLGYQAAEYDGETTTSDSERKDLTLRLGIAAFLWVNVMGFNLSAYLGAFDHMDATSRQLLPFLAMMLTIPVIFYSARPILRLAWKGLLHRALRMESLLALGILAAFSYSTIEAFRGGSHVYFDIACAIVTLVLLGKSIEQGAKHRAAQTIAALHRMLPKKARILDRGRERFIAIDTLHSGEVFVVKAGERIPADGIVVEGKSQADEALLTGESASVAKHPGCAVIAGSANLESPLTIRATTVGNDSTIAQIVHAVERALGSRSDLERKVDLVSRRFVPAVMSFAILTAAVLLWRGLPVDEALLRAITILVIACPCALGLATPLALTAAVGAASRAGILVRDARVLESIRAIDTVMLDKTGTITDGGFSLAAMDPHHLATLASLEQYSEHPIGAAIVAHAKSLGLALHEATSVEVRSGQGIQGIVDGERVTISQAADDSADTVIQYRIGERAQGRVTLTARIRPDAPALIAGLRARRIDTILLSGDSAAATQATAKALGIEQFHANVQPGQKATYVTAAQAQGRTVAMIGDGVNDAPALAAANLGIAMGSGADLAMHAASMVLLTSDLTRILAAFDLSRRTLRVVRQNLFWAFFYNTVGIGFAAAGWLNPLIAAGAMVFSSLSVITNSYRLSRITAAR